MTRPRTFLLLVGIVALLLAATYAVLSRTGVTRSFAAQVLRKFVRSDFELEDANLDLGSGTVRLLDLLIKHPRSKAPMLSVKDLSVSVDTNPLGEVGTVHEVRASGLVLEFALGQDEMPDLAEILHLDALGGGTKDPKSRQKVPSLLLTDSTIRVTLATGRPPLELHDVNLRLAPTTGQGDEFALVGALTTPFGESLSLAGTADATLEHWQVRIDGKNLTFGAAVLDCLDATLASRIRDGGFSGRIETLSVGLGSAPATASRPDSRSAPQAPLAGLQGSLVATLAGLRAHPKEVPYPLVDGRATLRATLENGGSAQLRLEAKGPLGGLTVGITASGLLAKPLVDARIVATDVPVDATLAAVVQSQEEGRDVWRAFEPSGGTVDGEVRLSMEHPGEKPDFAMDLVLHGVAARFEGFDARPGTRKVRFPHPLSDIRGKVQVRPGTIIDFEEVSATLDTAKIAVSGRITTHRTKGTQLALDVAAKGATFTTALHDALAELQPEAAKVWNDYSPRGVADATVRVRSEPGDAPADLAITIEPKRASAEFVGFPYRVDEVLGTVEIAHGAVALDLRGKRGGTEVEVRGRFDDHRQPGSEGLRSQLGIRGKEVVLDSELKKALLVLDPTLQGLWTELSPAGTTDCEVAMWRPHGEEAFTYDVRLDLRAATARMAKLPLPIENLHGPIVVHGFGDHTEAVVHLVEGAVRSGEESTPAALLLHGSVRTGAAGRTLDLAGVVRGLGLDAPLAKALDTAGMMTTATWDMLAPEGAVNVIVRVLQGAGEPEPKTELKVQLDRVVSRAKMLPSPATELVGDIDVAADGVRFAEIRGLIGTSRVLCTAGSVTTDREGDHVRARLSADEIPVDSRLANVLSGPLRQAFLDRGITEGFARISDLDMHFLRLPNQGPLTAEFSGTIVAHDVSLVLGAPIEHLSGTLRIDKATVDPSGGTIEGEVRDAAFHVVDHPVSSFTGRFRADPDAMTFDRLTLRLHEGILQGGLPATAGAPAKPALRYSLSDSCLQIHARLQGMSLSSFLSTDGQPSNLRGTVFGEFDIARLPGIDVVEVEGDAKIEIKNGKLGEVPLFRAIYGILAEKKRPRFERLELDLHAKNRMVEVRKVVIGSPLLELEGRGTCTMDGYLNLELEFPNLFGQAGKRILLPEILRRFTSAFVSTDFYGYLREPHARGRLPFSGDSKRRPLEPIPPRLPTRPQRRI